MQLAIRLTTFAAVAAFALPASAYKVDQEDGTITVVSVADFDKCASHAYNGDACLEALKAYVEKKPKEAFQAGKHARLQFQHWVAIPFFAKAFSKAASEAECKDEDVGMAVVSALALPTDNPNVALGRKVAEQCFAQLQPKLVSETADGTASYYRANACPLLAEKKVAAPECEPKKPVVEAPKPTAVDLLKGVDPKKLATDPNSARVYRSQRGEELLLMRTKPGTRELVLLKFKGITGPWNGQVLVAIERPGGRGKDYVTSADQQEWTVVSERDGYMNAYAKGVKETISLYEVPLDRGLKDRPTPGDVSAEFGSKPSAPTTKR